jgi:hypothetical protein
MEIGVRAYNRRVKEQKKHRRAELKTDKPSFDEIFVWDVETRITEGQALTFGSYIRKNIKNDVVLEIGIFYNPLEIAPGELKIVQEYVEKNPVVKLFTVQKFIDDVFYPNVYLRRIPVINFNTSFDVSRIATGYGFAKKKFKGGFVFYLSAKYPPIKIKHIGSAESFTEFQASRYSSFRGYFIDCATLSSIMSGVKHISLKKACELYNKKYFKIDAGEHGTISGESYLLYNRNDVFCTCELFVHLKEEYDRFGVSLPITKVFSGASIAKAVLSELGIHPMDTESIDPRKFGEIAQSYFGGLCNVGIRKQPVSVSVLDFNSMYPSLNILLGMFDMLICQRIGMQDATEDVKQLIESINTIDDLKNPNIWKQFAVICEIVPNEDLLSVRAKYNGDNFTVGLNYVTSRYPLYYGLPSIILSKLQTGKVPEIKRAIRFYPIGRQKTLRKAKILGIDIDPSTDNLFRVLVEERLKSKKAKDGREKLLKVISNVLSYGIYFEVNKENEKSDIMVYSGDEAFPDFKCFEREGRYYNPIIASIITDSAKLLLGIGECILRQLDKNEVVAYEDTDSLSVPRRYRDKIIDYFDFLNPYDRNLVEHFLKIEEDEILLYAISTKRYVLFSIDKKGDFVIKDDGYSLHGLGHLLSPFGKEIKNWEREVWTDILKLHYGKITLDQFLGRYKSYYAISQFTISTASLMKRFSVLNKGKKYNGMIKPFSFFNFGFSNFDAVKPIAPVSKDPQSMPYSKFINYKDGRVMQGQQYFKTMDDELWDYINHPESKSEGDIGVLRRRHITVDKIVYIGKEGDQIEQNLSGLGKVNYNTYRNPKDILSKILSLSWKDANKAGVSKREYYNLIRDAKKGNLPNLRNKTLRRLGF